MGNRLTGTYPPAIRFTATAPPKKKGWGRRLRNFFLYAGLATSSLVGGTAGMIRYQWFRPQIEGVIGDRFDKGIATYRSPTTVEGYVNNPQAVPYERGTFSSMFPFLSPMAQLERVRAEFNKTGDLNLFNPYLRYRANLMSNPAALKAHDAKIRAFVNHPKVEFGFIDKNNKAWELDRSTRYMVAARLVDLLHNRQDLLDKLVNQDPPLRIVLFENLQIPDFLGNGGGAVGHFSVGKGDITFSHDYFWSSIGHPSLMGALDIHEATHAMDAKRIPVFSWVFQSAVADGLLPGLSDVDIKTWEAERERLSSSFEQTGQDDGMGEYAVGHYDFKLPVLGTVHVRRRPEFVAEAVSFFYDRPQVLQKASPQIYDILKRYFRIDPIAGYKDIVP